MPRVNNTEFYNHSISRYKMTPRGVHWASKERQELRFEVFKKLLGYKLERATVVDAGCGFGDLYLYLCESGIRPQKYIGLDVHAKMVKEAKKRTRQTILQTNILKEKLPYADYYLCSGAMNILERFETVLFIKQMLKFAEKGVIFNILKGKDYSDTYNKYEPEEMLKLLAFFEGEIEIIEGYLDDDFTVYMKKPL